MSSGRREITKKAEGWADVGTCGWVFEKSCAFGVILRKQE